MKLCCLVVVYMLAICVFANETHQHSAYCQNLCTWGRGGNVCRCNAVHFTGKRATEDSIEEDVTQLSSPRYANGDYTSNPVPDYQPEDTTPVKGFMMLFVLRKSQNKALHKSDEKSDFDGRDLSRELNDWRETTSSAEVQNLPRF